MRIKKSELEAITTMVVDIFDRRDVPDHERNILCKGIIMRCHYQIQQREGWFYEKIKCFLKPLRTKRAVQRRDDRPGRKQSAASRRPKNNIA